MTASLHLSQTSSEAISRQSELPAIGWERYRVRLLGLLRKQGVKIRHRCGDEEDIVQNAFVSFLRGVASGRIDPHEENDDDLWPLLAVIAKRKAIDRYHFHNCRKRGGGDVLGESAFPCNMGESGSFGIEQMPGGPAVPETLAGLCRHYADLFASLADPTLKQVAVCKLEGFTNEEIAALLDCSRATVVRKLAAVRRIWRQLADDGRPE